jgi:DNA-binding NarL/FixJ family response regulator
MSVGRNNSATPDGEGEGENGTGAAKAEVARQRPAGAATADRHRRTTVLLVDDRAWTREALAHALEKSDRWMRVVRARSPSDLSEMAKPAGPAVILLSMNGAEPAERHLAESVAAARAAMPDTPIAALSDRPQAEDILRAIGRGLSGYVLACLEGRHVAMALRFMATGGIFVPAGPLLEGLDAAALSAAPTAPMPVGAGSPRPGQGSLTPRESAVLRLLREGLTNKQIARALGLREPTVKVHVHNVLLKLGATNRTQLALLAGRMAAEGEADGQEES